VANFEDPKIGGPAAMALTRTRGVLNDGTRIPYAFGIQHGEYRGLATEEHSGGWAGFSTFVLHFPQQRLGIVVLENAPVINPAKAAHDVADIFLGRQLASAQPAPRSQGTVSAASTDEIAPATLDRYAGIYRLGPGWFVRIRRDGTTMRVQATREAEVAMMPRADTSFWVAAYDAPMSFERDGGHITLTYRGMHRPKLDERSPPSRDQLAAFVGTYESDELQTRYRITLENGALVMHHFRLGDMPLTWLWGAEFGGEWWFMHSVEFQRDSTGRVTGFLVNVDERSRNIRFIKRA